MAGTKRSLCGVRCLRSNCGPQGLWGPSCPRSKCGPWGSWGPSCHTPSVDHGVHEAWLSTLRPEDQEVSWGASIVCGGKGGVSLASSSGKGQVSFLPPDSTITCPFSERRSGCSVVACHFPEPLTSCFLLYTSLAGGTPLPAAAGGRHSAWWKDFSGMTLHLPSLQPGLATSRRQVTVSP